MFEHSVKVPRHYKVAANIFKKAFTEGASVKTLLYDDKLRHHRINVLYALVTETIKHTDDLDKIFALFEVFEKEPRLDPWLAKVLATELLFGKKNIPGNSKPVQTILSYRDSFEKYVQNNQDEFQLKDIRKPRYVRINTNLLTTSDAISAFQDEGYRFIRCTSGSYSDYLKQITSLTEWDFTQDYHVKTVFVFASGTKLHEHELYLENKIILQDKATALSVHLLAPPPGSIALDMCSAPGMKTTQLAAYLRNTGKIYAVERDTKRYQTLCEFLKNTGCVNVNPMNKDVLEIKKGEMDDVEYILLDPSCSGSGMEYCLYKYKDYEERLQKLTSLQEKLLKHAMNSFPSAKRIVYSTCSLYPEENERVVVNVVKASRAKWRVTDVKELLKGQWNNYGSCMYGSLGEKCIYARPDSDFTIGFFVAVLDRNEFSKNDFVHQSVKNKTPKTKNQEEDINDASEEKKRKENHVEHQESFQISDRNGDNVIESTVDIDEIPKKKKKHKDYQESCGTENSVDDVIESRGVYEKKSKKKKKKKHDQNLGCEVSNSNDDNLTSIEEIPKKSKKKRKNDEDRESLINNSSDIAVESERVTPKKKTSKSKEFDDSVMDLDSTGEVRSKSKKRKRHEAEEIAQSEMESEVIPQKKKDKKAPKVVDEMQVIIPLDEAGAVPEKKKKSKNRKV